MYVCIKCKRMLQNKVIITLNIIYVGSAKKKKTMDSRMYPNKWGLSF